LLVRRVRKGGDFRKSVEEISHCLGWSMAADMTKRLLTRFVFPTIGYLQRPTRATMVAVQIFTVSGTSSALREHLPQAPMAVI
jgi:hypothetical protein